MRDGVELATDVFRPDDRRAAPGDPRAHAVRPPLGAARRSRERRRPRRAGYVVVSQDCRGRFDSEGDVHAVRDEADDGVDTIEWVAAQPWSNGRVGDARRLLRRGDAVAGGRRAPPQLRAIAPNVTASDYHEGWVYQGGAFQLGLQPALEPALAGPAEPARPPVRRRAARRGNRRAARRDRPDRPPVPAPAAARDRPACDRSRRGTTSGWRTPSATRSGGAISPRGALRVHGGARAEHRRLVRHLRRTAPAQLRAACARTAATEDARRGQRLIVGPWSHATATGTFAERHYGERGRLRRDRTRRACTSAFFDRWLQAASRRRPSTTSRRSRLFLMGANEWRHEIGLAAAGRRDPALVPARRRAARTAPAGDGVLSPEAPGRRAARRVPLRPARPGAERWAARRSTRAAPIGWNAGPCDQRAVEAPRRRARLHVGAAATGRSTVIGPVEAVLFVSLVRARHGLHREARRRPSRRPRRDPGRRDPARCATAARSREPEPAGARPRSKRCGSRSAAPPTCSWPAIGSGSTSRAATSRASTPTRTPAARSPTEAEDELRAGAEPRLPRREPTLAPAAADRRARLRRTPGARHIVARAI